MSVYWCAECDTLVDCDYRGCNEHPKILDECCCDDCYFEILESLKKYYK